MSIPLFVQKAMPNSLWQGEWLDCSVEFMRPFRLLAEVGKRLPPDEDFRRACDGVAQTIEDAFEHLSSMVWQRFEEHAVRNLLTRRQIQDLLTQCLVNAAAAIKEADNEI